MTPGDLKAARQALGLTRTALAERLGIGRNTLWRWETGAVVPEHPVLLELAMAYLLSRSRSQR